MPSDLLELATGLVNQRLREKNKEDTHFWIFEHREDVHCVMFHLLVLAAYGVAFFVYLHPDRAHIHNRVEMTAFVLSAILLIGWVSGINVGVNFHNHVHRRLFRVVWLNQWFGRLWSLTGCWPSRLWLHSHVTVHHADTLGPTDWTLPKRRPDGSFEGKWKYSFLHWPWRYFPHLWRDCHSETYPRLRSEAPKELLIFCALYSIPFWIDPMMGLFLWLAPAWFGNVLILGSGMYVQHVGCEPEDEIHPFRTSNTYLSRFFNLVAFNIGYHNLHHTFPHIHWSDLPEFQRLIQDTFDADGAVALRVGYFRASVELTRGREWPDIVKEYSVAGRAPATQSVGKLA
jgi:fatty acid desaturase